MRHIQRGQIEQLERPEAKARLLAHDPVDVRETRHAFARHAQAFGIHAAAGVIDDEAGHVFRAHRRVTHAAREVHQRVAGSGVAAQAVDHFDDLHQRNGIEEVIADHARRVAATGGNRRDRQRRRVRREHATAAHHGFEFAKERLLHVELFDDRLDHQVAIGQLADRPARRCTFAERGERARLFELAFGRQLGESLGEVVARGADRGGVGIVQTHGQARQRGDLGDAAAHCAGSDNADSLDAEIARGHCDARLHGYFRIARSCNLLDD